MRAPIIARHIAGQFPIRVKGTVQIASDSAVDCFESIHIQVLLALCFAGTYGRFVFEIQIFVVFHFVISPVFAVRFCRVSGLP